MVGIDWATTGIYFLKGVHLLVPLDPPPALHPPPTVDTETAAIKGIDAGKTIFPHQFFGYCGFFVYFHFEIYCVSVLAVILAHSQTAASPVIFDLSCHEEVREEHEVVVMTGIEDMEVEREDVEEGVKPTEEDGKSKKNCVTKITLKLLLGH